VSSRRRWTVICVPDWQDDSSMWMMILMLPSLMRSDRHRDRGLRWYVMYQSESHKRSAMRGWILENMDEGVSRGCRD
jgi:hypothetical protein